MYFGAFAAGGATTNGPDIGKAIKAAVKIFRITDLPSEINAVDIPEDSVQVPPDFEGEIEFRDVWFRYPLRPKQWVFKGLNLKINPKDCIAIVGESGQGKSTFINLLMRFYDVTFGRILIDGIDIQKYNIRELR
jgi:ABC-type multidrug transport system fused ATPase/permease subunit